MIETYTPWELYVDGNKALKNCNPNQRFLTQAEYPQSELVGVTLERYTPEDIGLNGVRLVLEMRDKPLNTALVIEAEGQGANYDMVCWLGLSDAIATSRLRKPHGSIEPPELADVVDIDGVSIWYVEFFMKNPFHNSSYLQGLVNSLREQRQLLLENFCLSTRVKEASEILIGSRTCDDRDYELESWVQESVRCEARQRPQSIWG